MTKNKRTVTGRSAKLKDEDLKKFRESELKFRDILLISNDWIWEIDTEGNYIFTSGQIKEILGYEPEEIIGKSVFDMFLPEEKQKLKKEILKIIAFEKPIINRINWNLTKDGRKVCLVTNGIPVYAENGKLTGYRGVDKDITNQMMTEEKLQQVIKEREETENKLQEVKTKAEEDLKARTEFLSKVSHEIRNPINGIIGTVALLNETILNSEQREFLDVIRTSANNLLSILNDVLDISKIESGKMAPDSLNFNLIEVLNEIERLHAKKTKERKLDFTINIKPGVPKYIRADQHRIKQILINLLSNALKFTIRGSINISVEKKSEENNKITLLFKVKDSGIGIHKDRQKELFKEDTKKDAAITRTYGGTGLGLIISKKLVKLLGGNIGLQSSEGKGSIFWFTISVRAGESPSPMPMEEPEEEKVKDTGKLRVLVAEDNIINQKVAMANLRQLGHIAEVAVNGRMAVEMYKKNKYDLVLMDIQMPVMDGITATKEIRKFEKEMNVKKNIKIVAITANALKEDREKCLSNGMDDFILKPLKIEDLTRTLEST